MDSLTDLPLLTILSFVARNPEDLLSARQVCRRWRNLCREKSVWFNVDLECTCLPPSSDLHQHGYESVLVRCLRIAPVLNSLVFENTSPYQCSNITAKLLQRAPSKVRRLEFGYGVFSVQNFLPILHLFSRDLEDLTVVADWGTSYTRPFVSWQLPNLRRLYSSCKPMFEFHINAWPQLQELELSYVNIREADYLDAPPVPAAMMKLLRSCQSTLVKLTVGFVEDACLPRFIANFHTTLEVGFPHLAEIVFDCNLGLRANMDDYFPIQNPHHSCLSCFLCKAFGAFQGFANSNSSLLRIAFNMDDFGINSCVLRYRTAGNTKPLDAVMVRNECQSHVLANLAHLCNVLFGTHSYTFLGELLLHAQQSRTGNCFFTGCDTFIAGAWSCVCALSLDEENVHLTTVGRPH